MDRIEMNFKNPIVRMWFYTVLPTIIVAVTLLIILPMKYHGYVMIVETILINIYWISVFFYKRKIAN